VRFTPSAEQRQLAASVHASLSDADVPAAARAWAAGDPGPGLDVLARLARIGVGGLAEYPVEQVVVFEELGRHAVPGPLAESYAVVPALLDAPPDLATVALPPHVPYALDADVATPFVVVGGTLHLAERGARRESVDPARRLFEVRAGAPVGPAGGSTGAAFDRGVLCQAAQLLGLGRGLLDRACDHVTRRRQFGRAVGEFQAVRHRLADVLVALEFARPLVHAAAVTGSARDVSAARVVAADAAYRAARAALQVHGAVGFTEEHDLSLWLLKVRALRSAWGTQTWHRRRVLAALTAPGSR
jgi:alkylation response protein AidB-like acyl-CoA dehydrogenase